MKRTLFNTMMGCLAALSLAGCGGSGGSGGSGGGSSSLPTESLISEGFSWMKVTVKATTTTGTTTGYEYVFYFYAGGDCVFYLEEPAGNGTVRKHQFDGATWVAASQGNGVFRISISGGNLWSYPTDSSCTIRFAEPIELHIPNMEKYRAGEVVSDAYFTSAPFTHGKESNCPLQSDLSDIKTSIDSIWQRKAE
ncbi:MAG: hypothetical protein ACI4PY_03205 [Akkermansia muciniphila]